MNDHPFTLDDCVDMCLDCSESCLMTAAYCLGRGGAHAEKSHITLIQLCAETCQLAAKSMILESPVYRQFCDLASRICDQTAEVCAEYDDEEMEACTETCRHCAAICREVVAESQTVLPEGVTRLNNQNFRI